MKPLKIDDWIWEQDASGTPICSSYLYLKPFDAAKIAFLFINKGKYNNKQILTHKWVQWTLTTGNKTLKEHVNEYYGAHWWYYKDKKNNLDYFAARGYQGQYIAVDPKTKKIIVRFAKDSKKRLSLHKIIKALRK